MNIEEYESLPDSIEANQVHDLAMSVLSSNEAVDLVLAKLDILADRQWHTYELPNSELRQTLRKWLIQNWFSNDQEYLEEVLGLAYCFGLDKEFYQKALESYTGEHRAEFNRHLAKSEGDTIDPWWSMGKKNV